MRKRRVAPPAQRAASTAQPTRIDLMCSLRSIDFKNGIDFHFYISFYDRHLTIPFMIVIYQLVLYLSIQDISKLMLVEEILRIWLSKSHGRRQKRRSG